MSKKSNYQTFNFETLKDGALTITCYTYEYANGWGHKCYFWSDSIKYGEKRHTYYNRTWESFTYETLLQEVINALYSGKKHELEKKFLIAQVELIAKREQEKAEAWLAGMVALYNTLSEETKKDLASSDICFNSQEEAETTLRLAKMNELLKA